MALGGGTFVAQNKELPGAYMNFVSKSAATAALSGAADTQAFQAAVTEFYREYGVGRCSCPPVP